MTTFVFSGDPKAKGKDPAVCEMYGISFPLGEPVDVADENTADRLRRHNHFTEATEAIKSSDDLDGMKIADLREMADAKGIDHTGMSKSELRESLA